MADDLTTAGASIAGAIHFDIFTLFPQMFAGPFSESILRRAQDKGLISVALHDIRRFTTDRHHVCDGTPYGGGGGMVMKPEPIFRSVETVLAHPAGWTLSPEDAFTHLPDWNAETGAVQKIDSSALENDISVHNVQTNISDTASHPSDLSNIPIILLTPQGRPLTQSIVMQLSQHQRLALICGRYEGVDERVRTQLVTDEISLGDYVLSGGELAAMILVDAITRLIPGALGFALSAHRDSHSPGLDGLLEGPQYTRPPTFRGDAVPDVLLSGHHGNVDRWRREQALLRTFRRRPNLLSRLELTEADYAFLRKIGWSPQENQPLDNLDPCRDPKLTQ